MVISRYFYSVGTEEKTDRFELLEDRYKYMNAQYCKMFRSELQGLELDGDVAVLYAGGAGMHSAEARVNSSEFECTQPVLDSGPVIKNTQAYMLHRYIGMLPCKDRVVYANINSNTCASSLHSTYEAEKLLSDGVADHVVIIAEEKTSTETIRIFKEHNIDVKPGEGFACVVISKSGNGATIRDCKWAFNYNRNPFLVSEEGYSKVASVSDVVKGHKTGTEQNEQAEASVFGDGVIGYKDSIGHCQGASGLIELCMVLEDQNVSGSVLCTASGLGGFYGSCIVEK